MRKIIVLSFITLDGIMQAPGGPEEDTSDGFRYGGWQSPLFDEFMGQVMTAQMSRPFDLLLGHRTYDIFASYWPHQDESDPIAASLNRARKYVVSHAPVQGAWENTVSIHENVVDAIRRLKMEDGPELQVHGSGNLIQTLLENDLVDELWLKIYPLTLGPGKRLFAEGAIPAAFRLVEGKVAPNGVIVANYERAGEVQTGSF
jgi:dihydrofolate reductase